ncbi:MAG: hypothetical protein QOD39_5577 [Mycobacterium sp.]|nr:hypothetical protein [Mycobacterium sp.]
MTDVVVEVGPGTIRGPNDARPESISIALGCIDDDIALLDDRPVPVQDVWTGVMSAVAGVAVDTVVLVCPSWWPAARIDRVRAAALAVTTTVVVLQRTSMLRDAVSDRRTTIVELDQEFAVVSHLGVGAAFVPRRDGVEGDAEAVVSTIGASAAVLVDAPAGVEGADLLGATIADRLRAAGVIVTFTDSDMVRRAATTLRTRQHVAVKRPKAGRDRRGRAVLAGIASAAVLCGGFAMRTPESPASDIPMSLLVEGRVGIMVPAIWKPQRITSGPGSARVQIVSPSDADVVLHVTQSTGAASASLAMVADSLRAALGTEPDGVFVDFNPSDRRAGRPAVTYRELRPDHHIAWVVVIDGAIRIAIGCQSAPGREELVREACDRATRSAHAVF